MTGILTRIVLWLAYSNGANDNFKGVATLWGSRVASFRTALGWATATTAVDGLAAVLVAAELAEKFKGKGLVPPELLATPELAFAVGGGAAATILLATLLSMPTSTTHALVGGLLGASLAATGGFNALNPGKGLTANLITAGLILRASKFGLLVSTTHVSCGSIFGISLINRRMEWCTVSQIATAWVTTLPLAALFGGVTYELMQGGI